MALRLLSVAAALCAARGDEAEGEVALRSTVYAHARIEYCAEGLKEQGKREKQLLEFVTNEAKEWSGVSVYDAPGVHPRIRFVNEDGVVDSIDPLRRKIKRDYLVKLLADKGVTKDTAALDVPITFPAVAKCTRHVSGDPITDEPRQPVDAHNRDCTDPIGKGVPAVCVCDVMTSCATYGATATVWVNAESAATTCVAVCDEADGKEADVEL
eukprot:TRINITY_DN15225_c0_g1_i1.p1 TRINITY_DN15225_c0_g1~~TRINITY_DN15225_c0_g1_i1.p1  ORF type:complete len:230 (+),score=69.08 TRINITY_DN15225_c0_g1_i1:57-692(+)